MTSEVGLRIVAALEAMSTRLGLQETNSTLAAEHAKEQARALQEISVAVSGVPQLVRDAQTVLVEVANLRADFNRWIGSEAKKESGVRERLSRVEAELGQRNDRQIPGAGR